MLEDVAEEATNSGTTVSHSIVRAATLAQYQAKRPETKVGDVFLKFTETSGAEKCFLSLNGTPPPFPAPLSGLADSLPVSAGRMFAGNQVMGSYMATADFDAMGV